LVAWEDEKEETKDFQDDQEPKKVFTSSSEIIQDYSEYSTIQGLIYVYFSYQTKFGKLFWIMVLFLMFILGLYWIIKAYIEWQEKPVLTTITTTALAIKQVLF